MADLLKKTFLGNNVLLNSSILASILAIVPDTLSPLVKLTLESLFGGSATRVGTKAASVMSDRNM